MTTLLLDVGLRFDWLRGWLQAQAGYQPVPTKVVEGLSTYEDCMALPCASINALVLVDHRAFAGRPSADTSSATDAICSEGQHTQ
jgi:hypothetical protein